MDHRIDNVREVPPNVPYLHIPMPPVQPPRTGCSDAELIALAALAQVEAVLMAGDNAACALRGDYPQWRSGTGYMYHTTNLEEELLKRKNNG